MELEFFAGRRLLFGKKQIIKSTFLISEMVHLFEVERGIKPRIFFTVAGFGLYVIS